MSPQALVIAIVYALVILLSIIGMIQQKQLGVSAFFGLLLGIAFAWLIVYDTDCLTQGQCTVWSWIRTMLYVLFPVLMLILVAIGFVSARRTPAPLTEQPNTTA